MIDGSVAGFFVRTWPPLKPTATTPNSLGLERNLCRIVEGEVMVKVGEKEEGWREERGEESRKDEG